jgi:DeoR/GlpR family transcriptional regulator of sugar metabolism
MSETSSRLLELLSLLQGRRDCRGNELADRLEVSDRTIRRDIGQAAPPRLPRGVAHRSRWRISAARRERDAVAAAR